ncbi:MAG: hypothetical protein ACYDC9_13205 [Dermatophilaceae bacterium]
MRPSSGPAAAEPDRSPPDPDAGQVTAAGGGLDARYEQLRHAALHCRAQAFPLGFGMLRNRGVTGWRRALATLSATTGAGVGTPPTDLAPCGRPVSAVNALPAPVTTELINILAAVALAGTHPNPPPSHALAQGGPRRCSPIPRRRK